MKRIALITLVIAMAAVSFVLAGDGDNYGDGVTIDAAVPVETLLSSPDDYIGKAVRVDGVITGVCKKRGCWMQITDPDTGNGVRIKVDDGVIVFPPEIMGETAIVEGTLEGIPLTYEQACAYLEQEASCQGEKFDKSAVPEGGITFYRIKGTGAVIVPTAES